MKDWREIIKESTDRILEEMEKADNEAALNTHMQFTVYVCEDGSAYTFSDVAGGNSFPVAAHEGQELAIRTFCYQGEDILDNTTMEELEQYLGYHSDTNLLSEYKGTLEEEEEDDYELYWGFVKWLEEEHEDVLDAAKSEMLDDISGETDYSQMLDDSIEGWESVWWME